MPVRLHEIPGLQSTRIHAAPMDGKAAAAPAAALGEIGQAFAGISAPFAKIATNIQEAANAEQLSKIRTGMDEARAKFLLDLGKDQDPASRLAKTQAFLQTQKQVIDTPGLPRASRDKLVPYVDEWASSTNISVARDAARLGQRKAKAAVDGEMYAAYQSNDPKRLRTAFDNGVHAGVRSPEEWTAVEADFNAKQKGDAAARHRDADPYHFIQQPTLTGNDAVDGNNLRKAHQLLNDRLNEAAGQFIDTLSGNDAPTPAAVERDYGDLPPAAVTQLQDILTRRADPAWQAEILTPAYQEKTIGRLYGMIGSYHLTSGVNTDAIQIRELISTLPEDSASRKEIEREFELVRNQRQKTYENFADWGRQQIRDAHAAGGFGSITRRQTTESAIKAGLLRSREKLESAGFTPESIQYISGKDAEGHTVETLSDGLRQRRFMERYPQRVDKRTPADPYVHAQFEAVQSGAPDIIQVDPVAQEKADRAAGAVLREFDDWARMSPAKLKDEQSVREAIARFRAPQAIRSAQDQILPPPPTPSAKSSTPSPSH